MTVVSCLLVDGGYLSANVNKINTDSHQYECI